jgi:hypothetical protein
VTTERDEAIRSLLVQTANDQARRPWRRTALVAAIAFLLGGGVAFGALSATATTREQPLPENTAQDMFSVFLHGGRTIGPVMTYEGSDASSIDLGQRPADATGIADYIECRGSGTFIQTVGGQTDFEQQCEPSSGIGFSTDQDPTDTVVSTRLKGSFSYKIWAQWIYVPGPAAPSAAQEAALADGVITESEYRAAVDRFAACMLGAGYPIRDVELSPQLSWGNSSEANRNGVVDRCGDSEMNKVVQMWQGH